MSCAKFETGIALHTTGDLPAAQIARIESHLAECAACRTLADELRAGQALLGELREESLEDAMVAHLRQRVMAEVRATSRQPSRLYWRLALAAALLLALVLVWPRRHPPAQQALVSRRAAPRPVAASPARQVVLPAARKSRRHHRRAPAAQPGPPLLVQFVTDDPNIVIYWLIDQKPQGD